MLKKNIKAAKEWLNIKLAFRYTVVIWLCEWAMRILKRLDIKSELWHKN